MKVALESTVITHGLPYPQNVETAFALEKIVKDHGGTPATIGILDGQVKVGMTEAEIQRMAREEHVYKAGVRELPIMTAKKACASTTVSATSRIAFSHGIDVFATGGIGGVHPGRWDVSQDLFELSRVLMVVVCAGPKAILDLQATAEMLESFGVTTVAYQADEMPAFYSRKSGIPVPRVDSPQEIAQILTESRIMGLTNAVLVFNPIDAEHELSNQEVEAWDQRAMEDLEEAQIHGKEVTPFLLSRMAFHSKGKTIVSNRGLLENNVSLACEIALAIEGMPASAK